MRKRNPNDVIIAFTSDVQASLDEWSAVIGCVRDQPVTLRRGVSRDAFFRLAVRWELFRSDWHLWQRRETQASCEQPSRQRSTRPSRAGPNSPSADPSWRYSFRPIRRSSKHAVSWILQEGTSPYPPVHPVGVCGSRRARPTWRNPRAPEYEICHSRTTRSWSWWTACGT